MVYINVTKLDLYTILKIVFIRIIIYCLKIQFYVMKIKNKVYLLIKYNHII